MLLGSPKATSIILGNDRQHGHILYTLWKLLFLRLYNKEEGKPNMDNTETETAWGLRWELGMSRSEHYFTPLKMTKLTKN